MTTRKKYLKTIAITISSIALACITFFIGYGLYLKSYYSDKLPAWPKRKSDVRLEALTPFITKVEVNKDNGYFYILKMNPIKVINHELKRSRFDSEISEFSQNGYTPGKFPKFENRCALHKENLGLLIQASQCSNCIIPLKSAAGQDAIEMIGGNSNIRSELSDCISFLCQKGIYEKRLDTVLDYLNASLVHSFLQRGKTTLLGSCENNISQKKDFMTCCQVANSPVWSVKQMKRLLTTLQVVETPLAEPLRNDLRIFKGAIKDIYRDLEQETDKPFSSTMWLSKAFTSHDPKVTTAHIEAIYSHLINSLNDREIILGKKQQSFNYEEWIKWKDATKDDAPEILFDCDPCGRFLSRLVGGNVVHIGTSILHHRNHLAATRVFLAVKLFEREKGSLPDKAEDLVPTYLTGIPEDQFYLDGTKILYEKSAVDKWRIIFKGKDNKREVNNLYISPLQFSPISVSGSKKISRPVGRRR